MTNKDKLRSLKIYMKIVFEIVQVMYIWWPLMIGWKYVLNENIIT